MTAMRRSRASAFAAFLLFNFSISSMTQAAERDFSETLDQSWNFNAPSTSESRFRTELAKHVVGSREACEIATQIARSLGLQRRFADADATLDALLPGIDKGPARIRVRYLLERGRILNSSGKPAEAVPLFKEAASAALKDPLPGAEFYRVDALHMLGIAAPTDERLRWNLEALAVADASRDERARGWRASLLHNIGWTYHERGEYARAVDYWKNALAAREEGGDKAKIRVAKWTVARGLRSLNRLDEAEKIQRELSAENDEAGTPDGFVYEELAEIALARHDAAAAKTWAAKAYAHLKNDIWLAANEKPRLDRLAEIGGVQR
jgi:tetratricopeptide (TPR) repeat protein